MLETILLAVLISVTTTSIAVAQSENSLCVGLGSNDEWIQKLSRPIGEAILEHSRCEKRLWRKAVGKYQCVFQRYTGIERTAITPPEFNKGPFAPEKKSFRIEISELDEEQVRFLCVEKLETKGMSGSEAIHALKSCERNFRLTTDLDDISLAVSDNAVTFNAFPGDSSFTLWEDGVFLYHSQVLQMQHIGQGFCQKILR
jgi:hypothetical protein